MTEPERVSVTTAAELLGVRRETIYAYVSRGLLERTHAADPEGRRVSLLDLRQVRDLARRTHRQRSGRFELTIDTSVSDLDADGRLAYRGRDAIDLAASSSFESVTEILWQTRRSEPWLQDGRCDDRCARTAAAAPPGASPADRARIALSLLAAGSRPDHDPSTAARAAIISCARVLAPEPIPWLADVASTVATALAPDPPTPSTVDLVRRALVLLADHELATSTVAARAAAGTGASIELALLTGAAALGGPLHGLASEGAGRTLTAWLEKGEVSTPAGGFGHGVYAEIDPRADDLLEAVLTGHPELSAPVGDLILRVLQRDGLHPNVDLALATLGRATRLRPGSGEAIFLIARLAGLAAHATEEHEQPLRFRPRAVYTGAPSGSGPT